MTELVLGQVFHGLFYAPNYVARALGYFREEGLEVTVRIADPPSSIIEMLFSGQADIVLAGPARLHERGDRHSAERVLCIGRATSRNFFFLVSRATEAPFDLPQLVGKRFLLFPGTPTPWLCLQYLLRLGGIDPSSIEVHRPASPEEAIRTYVSGGADFIELPEPYVEQLLDEMGQQRVTAIGPLLGDVPFTIYLANRGDVNREPDRFQRFSRAITRAGRWLQQTSAESAAKTLAEMFPEVRVSIIARSIARYQQQHLWTGITQVAKTEFDRLYTILTGEGTAPSDLYRTMVHPALA